MRDRRSRTALCLGLGLGFGLGCAGDGPGRGTGAGFVVRDSAGVVIAEGLPAYVEALPVWGVEESPELVIGVLEGAPEYELHQASSPRQLSDGRIVLMNRGTSQLRWYDAAGRHVRSAGRRGAGPGEFAFPVFMATLPGDTAVVYDLAQRRFSWFSASGDFVRSSTPMVRVSGVLASLGENRLLAAELSSSVRGEGIHTMPLSVHVIDIEALTIDTIARAGAWQQLSYSPHGEQVLSLTVPFTVQGGLATDGERIFVTDGLAHEVRVLDATGALTAIFRIGREPEPLQRSEFERVVRLRIEEGAERWTKADLRRAFASMTPPATVPAFDLLHAADDGTLWAREFEATPGSHRRWIVFDGEGRVVARAATPAAATIAQVTGDGVLAMTRDDLGVQRVVRYRLRR